MIKRLALLLAISPMAYAEAEEWTQHKCEIGGCIFSAPPGWKVSQEQREKSLSVVISRSGLDSAGKYDVGLKFQLIIDGALPGRSNEEIAQIFESRFRDMYHVVAETESNDAPFFSISFLGELAEEGQKILYASLKLRANQETGTLYVINWDAAPWEEESTIDNLIEIDGKVTLDPKD